MIKAVRHPYIEIQTVSPNQEPFIFCVNEGEHQHVTQWIIHSHRSIHIHTDQYLLYLFLPFYFIITSSCSSGSHHFPPVSGQWWLLFPLVDFRVPSSLIKKKPPQVSFSLWLSKSSRIKLQHIYLSFLPIILLESPWESNFN